MMARLDDEYSPDTLDFLSVRDRVAKQPMVGYATQRTSRKVQLIELTIDARSNRDLVVMRFEQAATVDMSGVVAGASFALRQSREIWNFVGRVRNGKLRFALELRGIRAPFASHEELRLFRVIIDALLRTGCAEAKPNDESFIGQTPWLSAGCSER